MTAAPRQVTVLAIVCGLFFLFCFFSEPADALPPNILTVHAGRGTAQLPGSGARIPAGFSDITASVNARLDALDADWQVTSVTTNLGEYNCQIFTCLVSNGTCGTFYLKTLFEYWGIESGLAYSNGGTTFVPPNPNLWVSIYNTETQEYEIVGTAQTNFTWLINSVNAYLPDTRLTQGSSYLETVNDTCVVTYGACGVVWSDSSTPLVYSWQGDAKGYQYLGELGEGYLTPLPRSWEDAPNYNQAGPVYPDGYYVFPASSFVSVDRGSGDVWEIQYCEEKEEFSFTDFIQLSYVDTPVGVSVFPDYHRTSTLFGVYDANVADVSSCVDQDGSNCLSTISSLDGNEWIVSTEPGVTPSYLEFGLGVTSVPSNLKLILTMRFYKNLLTWRKFRPALRATELHQYDQTNGWTPVPSPYTMGLRGASNVLFDSIDFDRVTRVLDLTGMTFNQADGEELKLRLVFYWQYLPIAVDRVQLDMTAGYSMPAATALTPVYADLHFRGVSTTARAAAANIPGYTTQYSPVYDWGVPLDMSGNLTHYGDVLSLITSKNDEYVIMGTGDEMTVRFTAPSSGPSNGNQRTVIFHSRCWYKAEGKATGRTVDQLPFASMTKYPYNPSVESYDSASHASFLAGNTRSYVASVPHFSLYSDKVSFTINETDPITSTSTSTSTSYVSGTERAGGIRLMTSSLVALVLLLVSVFVALF